MHDFVDGKIHWNHERKHFTNRKLRIRYWYIKQKIREKLKTLSYEVKEANRLFIEPNRLFAIPFFAIKAQFIKIVYSFTFAIFIVYQFSKMISYADELPLLIKCKKQWDTDFIAYFRSAAIKQNIDIYSRDHCDVK